MGDAELSGNGTGAAGEMEGWTPAGIAADFQFLPGNAVVNAGTESLGGGFLSGETGGEGFGGVGFCPAIVDFGGGKDAAEESVAVALDGTRDARHFDEVDPGTHEHEATVAQRKTLAVRPLGVR